MDLQFLVDFKRNIYDLGGIQSSYWMNTVATTFIKRLWCNVEAKLVVVIPYSLV